MTSDDHPEIVAEGTGERLCAAYGFDEAGVGERLSGGYANDMFSVVADGAQFVVRIKHPPAIHDDIAWEQELMRQLSERLPEVSAPVVARDGGTVMAFGDCVGWLIPFVDGRPPDAARETQRLASARGLGRLHRAGQDLTLPPRPRLRPLAQLQWPPLIVPDALSDWSATIARTREWAISYVATVARSATSRRSRGRADQRRRWSTATSFPATS
jgi:Ser/Thr protein kinase RdoA (MazF antagonist)